VTFEPDRARAHLEALAEAHHVELVWVRGPHQAEAQPGRAPVVYTPKPTTFWRYVVGLHEFGHILDDDAQALWLSSRHADVAACESYAWTWAFEHVAKLWAPLVTDAIRRQAGSYWSTFLNGR
jgi:hypothetical protein